MEEREQPKPLELRSEQATNVYMNQFDEVVIAQPESGRGEVADEGMFIHMSPQRARLVAAELVRWADFIDCATRRK